MTKTKIYSKQEITQSSKCYACGSQGNEIRDCNADRNIFVRYDEDDTMDLKELRRIIKEYEKIKTIKLFSIKTKEQKTEQQHVLKQKRRLKEQ